MPDFVIRPEEPAGGADTNAPEALTRQNLQNEALQSTLLDGQSTPTARPGGSDPAVSDIFGDLEITEPPAPGAQQTDGGDTTVPTQTSQDSASKGPASDQDQGEQDLAPLGLEHIHDNFRAFDTAPPDGHVTRREITSYLNHEHQDLPRPLRLGLRHVQNDMANLEELADDELFDENSGASRQDVAEGLVNHGLRHIRDNFSAFDTQGAANGGNGTVSAREISAYLQRNRASLDSATRRALTLVAADIANLQQQSRVEYYGILPDNPGISRNDINARLGE